MPLSGVPTATQGHHSVQYPRGVRPSWPTHSIDPSGADFFQGPLRSAQRPPVARRSSCAFPARKEFLAHSGPPPLADTSHMAASVAPGCRLRPARPVPAGNHLDPPTLNPRRFLCVWGHSRRSLRTVLSGWIFPRANDGPFGPDPAEVPVLDFSLLTPRLFL